MTRYLDENSGKQIVIETNKKFTAVESSLSDIPNQIYITEKVKQSDLNITNENVANNYNILDSKINSQASGSPKVVYLVASMTDITKNYIYMGVEGGYTSGNWYYWNDSNWVSGGVYQGVGIAEKSIGMKETKYLMCEGLQSKNLFDKSSALVNKRINYVDGAMETLIGFYASDYIKVLPSTRYALTKYSTGSDLAFYNASKVYISGMGSAVGALITPVNCEYVRFTTAVANINIQQFEIGDSRTAYASAYPKTKIEDDSIATSKLQEKAVTSSKIGNGAISDVHVSGSSNILLKEIGKNKLDSRNQTLGNYVQHNNGALFPNVSFLATDFITITPSLLYTLSNQKVGDALRSLDQLAFYDTNKTYISGLSNSGTIVSVSFTTPSNACYIRVSLRVTHLGFYQLEEGSKMTDLEQFAFKLSTDNIQKRGFDAEYFTKDTINQLDIKNIIVVNQDGTGDFTTMRSAIDSLSTIANSSNPYEIQIHEGTYDVFSDFAEAEINATSFIGLRRQDGVSFVGIGNADKIILKGELADTFIASTMLRVSTVNLFGNGDIENLTITAKNLRYCVHDDYDSNVTRNAEKVKCIKYVGGGYAIAWGGGTHDSSQYNFKDCYFYTESSNNPFSYHNNIGFTNPSKLKLENCTFEGGTGGGLIQLKSLGSGVKDVVEIIGCKYSGINLSEENTYAGVGIDFNIVGYANDIVPIKFTHTKIQQPVYKLIGETKDVYNATISTITKGTPIILNSDGYSVLPFLIDTSQTLFYGIAFEDILPLKTGVIKIGGYIQIADTNLNGLIVGDKIGIVGGVLAKITTGEHIGVVTINDFIKLI